MNRNQIKDIVTFIIKNTYLDQNNKIFHQRKGIPMGTDAAPMIANLYLYWYESNFIDKICVTDKEEAKRYNNTYRFIDDLLIVNNDNSSKHVIHTAGYEYIYPRQLEIKETTCKIERDLYHVQFLGLDISVNHSNTFRVKVYDKRDSFSFPVERYPKNVSCIPDSMIHGVIIGELKRYLISSSDINDFIEVSNHFKEKLTKNGWTNKRILRSYLTFTSKLKEIKKIPGINVNYMSRFLRNQFKSLLDL